MFITLGCISSQKSTMLKINKSEYVDILYNISEITSQKPKVTFYLKNNTGSTFIIDPFGFWGNTFIYENQNLIMPYKFGLKGFYERFSDKWCERDLIILKPHELRKMDFFNTNYKDTALYHFKRDKKYYEIVKSVHNKETVFYLGCQAYIKNLESKGYKILEDSINVKMPLYPDITNL